MDNPPGLRLPDGKQFAFTILDDTDDSTVANVKPIYELLRDLGYRTTKTVWPVDCPEGSDQFFAGETLSNPEYRAFCLDLATQGFEVTWHCATMESSTRERTIRGLETFRQIFGGYPSVHVNHSHNRENVYWGRDRYRSPLLRTLAGLRGKKPSLGHDPASPYFWGDHCLRHFRFARNFTFYELNTHKADPNTPYRLTDTPFVQYWFSTSDAADVTQFRRLVTRAAVDRLHRERGLCILSTHLGKGFCREGRIDPHVADILRYMATLPGWFVPVTTLLDHLMGLAPRAPLSGFALAHLELSHVSDRLRGIR
jgi:hypothetical protein